MSEFLVLLLMQAAIFSSVTALIILAVKCIFHCWIPPKIGLLMWIVLLIRLASPIFPESVTSVYNLIPIGRDIMFTMTYDIEDEIEERELIREYADNPYIVHTTDGKAEEEIRNRISGDNPNSAVSIGMMLSTEISGIQKSEKTEMLTYIINGTIVAVYVIGIVVLISANLHLYFKAKRRAILMSYPVTDESLLLLYRETARGLGIRDKDIPPLRFGDASMLVGCFKPQVICTEGMTRREAEMTFTHELNHYKHNDNPILLFSTVVACLFWYNPLLWIVRNKLRDDIELLCDERTLNHCKVSGSEYAMMLCKNSGIGQLFATPAASYMSPTGRKLKTRLQTISWKKNRRFMSKITAAFLCGVMVTVCLTNPVISQNDEYAAYIDNYSKITGDNRRVMHLSSQVTVTQYLTYVSAIVGDMYDESFSDAVGNGSLEKFRRIVSDNEYVSRELYLELKNLKTDEYLTSKSLAIINSCLISILANDTEVNVSLIPRVVSEHDMKKVLSNLSSREAEMLLGCYNVGLDGIGVEFSYVYTEAMYELIKSRLYDDWDAAKLDGFYTRARVGDVRKMYEGTELEKVIRNVRDDEIIYTCTSNITKNEERDIRGIISSVESGANDSIYYLRTIGRLCTDELLEKLFVKGGFNLEKMYEGYAEIGYGDFNFLGGEDYSFITDIELDRFGARIKNYNRKIGDAIYDYYEHVSYSSDVYTPRSDERYYALKEEYAGTIDALAAELNMVAFPIIRDGEYTVRGFASDALRDAIDQSYRLGLIDVGNLGYIDLSEEISCGESLYYAYHLVSSMINVN